MQLLTKKGQPPELRVTSVFIECLLLPSQLKAFSYFSEYCGLLRRRKIMFSGFPFLDIIVLGVLCMCVCKLPKFIKYTVGFSWEMRVVQESAGWFPWSLQDIELSISLVKYLGRNMQRPLRSNFPEGHPHSDHMCQPPHVYTVFHDLLND